MRRRWLGLAALIAAPHAALAQCPDGTPPPCGRAAAATPAPNSVAVLYFDDVSRDTSAAYLADGLTEEIIARLSSVGGLRVASRFAALRYRGRPARDPRQIGRELGVHYLLDGTVRRAGDRLRIVLTMTDATAGFNVWGQTYEQPLGEFFSVQDSIAVQVAGALRGRLTGGERAGLERTPADVGIEAYQELLQARVAIRSRTAAAAAAAIAHYRRAIALDPRFARAWAGLAQAASLARDWGWRIPGMTNEAIQATATDAARQALALDSTAADAWLAAAMAERARDLRRALQDHRRAVDRDSTNVETVHQLAWGYLGMGELDSAIAYEQRAIQRDPFYAYAYAGLAEMLNVAGRPEEALTAIAEGRAVDSANAPLYWQMADADLQLGRVAEATAAADRASLLGFDPNGVRILRILARIGAGDTASARADLTALDGELQRDSAAAGGGLAYTSAGLLSGAYARLGDVANAVRWAGRVAVWPRRFYAVEFARHWYWAPVRRDRRFETFLASLRS